MLRSSWKSDELKPYVRMPARDGEELNLELQSSRARVPCEGHEVPRTVWWLIRVDRLTQNAGTVLPPLADERVSDADNYGEASAEGSSDNKY